MMIRRGIIPFFVLFALSISVSSCLEDINLDTGERILNVYCVLRNGPEQELELSYIAPVGGTSRPVGEEVTVSLYDGDTPVGQFTRTSETKWNLDFSPLGGHTYRLEVRVLGEDILTAETKYPSAGSLQRVLVQEVEKVKDFPTMLGEGPVFTGYGFELDSPEDQVLWCYFEPVKPFIVPDLPAFADYITTDHPGVDGRGETIYPFDGDSPIIQEYFEEGHLYNPTGSVLSQDYLGGPVFLHEKVLRIVHPAGFNRPLDDGKLNVYQSNPDSPPFHVSPEVGTTGMFGIGGVNSFALYADLVICSVSAEYDVYLSDFYYGRQESGDFTALVYKRNHFSNVRNGTGIFGASFEYRLNEFFFGYQTYYTV